MKNLLCLGDSITDCNRLFSPSELGEGYVNILNSMINTFDTPCSISNKGIDGFTVSRLLQLIREEPGIPRQDIITILIGINDIGLMMNTGRSPQQIQSMMHHFHNLYEDMICYLKSNSQAKLILMEPFIFPYPTEYALWVPYVKQMSGIIEQLSFKYQLTYLKLHDYLNLSGQQHGLEFITTDGIHLTPYAHKLLASRLFQLLKPLL